MSKGRKRKERKALEVIGPTTEQLTHGSFESALMAQKRVITIVKLYETRTLTERQFKALARYRDVAIAEDRSPLRDSLDKAEQGGSGGLGLPAGYIRAAIELGRLERALGALVDIAREVCLRDMSLSQWAMAKYGARQRWREGKGQVVTWFEPHRRAFDEARVDIRMAGEWLAAEIGA
jgi:hypothetical protein